MNKEKLYYDQHTKVLPPLQPGSHVAIRSRVDTDWSLLGTVLEIRPNRTFAVQGYFPCTHMNVAKGGCWLIHQQKENENSPYISHESKQLWKL